MSFPSILIGIVLGVVAYFICIALGLVYPWPTLIGVLVGVLIAFYGVGIYEGRR